MSQETERKEKGIPATLVIGDGDRWAFALCALASKKVVRDATLITDSYGIFEMLQKLEEQGIVELDIERNVMPGRGWRVVAFDTWVYQLNEFLGGYAKEDEYEEKCLKIDPATKNRFLQIIDEELNFANDEKRRQILEMAKVLGVNELLESLEKVVQEKLREVCALDVNRPFLSVLIPLSHILLLDQSSSLYLYSIGPEIASHRNACRCCRNFLRENGLLEPAV